MIDDRLAIVAASLARSGLAVLALHPFTKRPRKLGGYLAATTDVDAIAAWWDEHPADNVGVRPPEGVLVVDIDPRNGGDDAMRERVGRFGRLPATWVARTAGGGWHYWLTVTGLPAHVPAALCDGVDLKHGGSGYVVAPPSVLVGGGRYRWLSDPVGAPAPAPSWLTDEMHARAERLAVIVPTAAVGGRQPYSLKALCQRVLTALPGERNQRLYGAARDAARQGELSAVAPALIVAAVAAGLPEAEAHRTVSSAARRSA
jgi:hypothetical protein